MGNPAGLGRFLRSRRGVRRVTGLALPRCCVDINQARAGAALLDCWTIQPQSPSPMTAAPPTSDLNALQGEKGLVVDIANGQSIAGGCGRALRDAGSHVLG